MSSIKVVGFDPSMTHWGIATGRYDLNQHSVGIDALSVIQPVKMAGKQIRQNSKDVDVAEQLYTRAWEAVQGAQAVFVEVPVGSQSARAAVSYAMCIGILAGFRVNGIPFFEVTPTEVKMVSVGKKNASKLQMIEWGLQQHPAAPWPYYTKHGQQEISATIAEHMADAIATIYAGVNQNTFKQMLSLQRAA